MIKNLPGVAGPFLLFFLLTSGLGGYSPSAQALTRGQFTGPYGIIRILARDFYGNLDPDGQTLYEAMNVPPKNSIIGLGKAIETADKELRFICAQRAQVGHECSIFITHGNFGRVNSAQKSMEYSITGEKADIYGRLFVLDGDRKYHFKSTDGLFELTIQPGLFRVHYQESPPRVERSPAPPPPKTLVIVNIQDTLKLAHVQNFWDSLNYVSNIRRRFLGMSAALMRLRDDNPTAEFVYLVNEENLMAGKNEREFLRRGRFPKGLALTYFRSGFASTPSFEVLHHLLLQKQPERVLLISHNGGLETQIFHQLVSNFPQIQFFTYIHMVYSSLSNSEKGTLPYPEQIGYVTAGELLMDWEQKDLVDYTQTITTLQGLLPRILSEDIPAEDEAREETYEYAFPTFLNCDDFQWRWSVKGDYQFMTPLRDHLRTRCHMQPPL